MGAKMCIRDRNNGIGGKDKGHGDEPILTYDRHDNITAGAEKMCIRDRI